MSDEAATSRPAGAPMVEGPAPRLGADEASQAADAIERARVTVSSAVDDARDATAGLREQARERARGEVDERSSALGQYIEDLAPDVRAAGECLRERGRQGVADVLDQIADRMMGAGEYLEEADFDRLTRDLARETRERPAVVIAAAGVLGLAAARALRAAELSPGGGEHREQESPSADQSTAGQASTTGSGVRDE